MNHLGQTRSVRRASHALHTPDAFIRTQFAGMEKTVAIVHTSPAMGAGFTQYTAEMMTGGRLGETAAQRFLYVLDGSIEVALVDNGNTHTLTREGFAYLPQGSQVVLTAIEPSRLAIIEKKYQPLQDIDRPQAIFSREDEVPGAPLGGDTDLMVRSLLPDSMSFDFAVNTMTYQPGAALSMVEMHVMEHGLLMLEGGGIYRLDDRWYSVTAGDFIWMGPYCPQWFGAIGKVPAKYLIYKDWNRHPLG